MSDPKMSERKEEKSIFESKYATFIDQTNEIQRKK